MRSRLAKVILLCMLSFSSCQSEYQEFNEILIEGMEKTGFESLMSKEFLIILPRAGCTGCISSVEEFSMKDSEKYSSRVNILLTDVVSLKTARIKLGADLLSAEHVFVDTGSHFYRDVLVSLYPMIISLDNGRIKLVEEVSPENIHAMDRFYSLLITE